MRWLARITVALTLSAAAVAALTWAGWPRPRSVVAIEATGNVAFRYADEAEPPPPYRLLSPFNSGTDFWFLAPDGRLLGPWRPGRRDQALGFDRAGRFLAECWLGEPDYQLACYDPETGREETLVSLEGPAPIETKLSGDRSTFAIATTDPLAFDLYDVADGRKRTRLTFPGRAGGFDLRKAQVAASSWSLSPDGRELLLAEAWGGAKRLGPPGVEVYNVATGQLSRRLAPPRDAAAPPEPPDYGVILTTHLVKESPSVGYHMFCHRSSEPDGWVCNFRSPDTIHVWDLASGKPLPPVPPADPTVVKRREYEASKHGGRALWLSQFPAEYRVHGPDGAPLGDWRPVPREFGGENRLITCSQPGRPAVVHQFSEPGEDFWPPWVSRLAGRFGRPLPPPAPTDRFVYHDWSTDEFRRVHAVPTGPQTPAVDRRKGGWQTFAASPNDLAILTPTPTGGTLSLWDLPPPRLPWPWSVPAGVALGVLLTAAGVRLRRRAASVSDRRFSAPALSKNSGR